MIQKHTRSLLLSCIIFSFASSLYAQTQEQQNLMKRFAAEQSAQWRQQRRQADSMAIALGLPLRKDLGNGHIIELDRFENGTPYYNQTDNVVAARTISSSSVWANSLGFFSLSGFKQKLGVWDGGIPLIAHQEYGNRVTVQDGSSSVAQHATHVAGTMVAGGINASAKGMSYEATLDAYDWNNDLSELTTAASNGLRVSSHSYGNIIGWSYNYFNDNKWVWFGDTTISATEDYKFGLYNNSSRLWDNMTSNSPYLLVVKSAGNDREDSGPAAGVSYWLFNNGNRVLSTTPRNGDGGSSGYDCIGDGRSLAKNVLTVGAIRDLNAGYTNAGEVKMTTFSSWGPADDGRIKPDVVGNGYELLSCDNVSTTSYVSMSGTSMATPNVSGSVGLLLQLYSSLYGNTQIKSTRMKGLIIHTADEAGGSFGPDYIFGWGLMNTFKAAQMMKQNFDLGGDSLMKDLTLHQGEQLVYTIQSAGKVPLKVTTCWNDPPGIPTGNLLNPRNRMLINDLDIKVTGPNAVTYKPWVLNPNAPGPATQGDNIIDNIEQVFIEKPVAGTYTVTLSHKGTLLAGQQDLTIFFGGVATSLPEQAALVAPANDTTGLTTSVTLSWTKPAKALWFRLQVAKDSLFSNVSVDLDSVFKLAYTVNNLAGLTKYYWRVAAVNDGGNSNWSSVRSFSTSITPPVTPAPAVPLQNAIVPIQPVLSWNREPVAETYQLQVSNNQIFTSIIFRDSTITDTALAVPGLSEGKKYFWRVNAKNIAGSSAFSTARIIFTKLKTPDSLHVEKVANSVKLTWKDNSGSESYYQILKKTGQAGFVKLDSIAANTTTYTDTVLVSGTQYTYKVFAGSSVSVSDTSAEAVILFVGVDGENSVVPSEYQLFPNYPNPFNPATTIRFSVPKSSPVTIAIYNQLGEKIAVLLDRDISAGNHTITWNAGAQPSGIYFCKMQAGTFSATHKLVLMK